MTLQSVFDAGLRDFDPKTHGDAIGVAVSGGSDSTAALLLAQDWAKRHGVKVVAATVDHGLRPEAAAEALQVADLCNSRGIAHKTLEWSGWDRAGNLQAKAREARYTLLGDWASSQQIDLVILGHTADDQAETVLMALARGSGVDGLAGMAATYGELFRRPLLSIQRDELRAFLRAQDVPWIDDPSNDDPRFDRVAARQMLPHLAELGLTQGRLQETARHMARAQRSLKQAAAAYVDAYVTVDGPDLILPACRLDPLFDDTQGRVLAAALQWIGGAPYRPRFTALCDAAHAVRVGETRTLHGVVLLPQGDEVRLMREASAAKDIRMSQGGEAGLRWDGRWVVTRQAQAGNLRQTNDVWPPDLTIKALGDAISEAKNWRSVGLPRRSLMATPAIFEGENLLAAPIVDPAGPFLARIATDFRTFVVMH